MLKQGPEEPTPRTSHQAPRKSVLSVLGNWLQWLVILWIYPAGPVLGLLILVALSSHWLDGFQRQHPAISNLAFVFGLASIFAHVVLEGWSSRGSRKRREGYAAARAKEQAETIQAMQEVSYWLDSTVKAEATLGMISSEVVTMAHWLARKRVEKEIEGKGFRLREVSVREIKKAAVALLSAQRPQLIEQARTRLQEISTRGPSHTPRASA